MAADSSFTQMLFFIAAIVVAVSVSGVLIGMSGSIAQEMKLKSNNLAEKMGTDILIINDPRSVPYQDGNLTLYVKNVGDITLNYNSIVIFIDGQYMNDTAIVPGSNARVWPVSGTITVNITVGLVAGDHLAKVVMPNGVYDAMTFRI